MKRILLSILVLGAVVFGSPTHSYAAGAYTCKLEVGTGADATTLMISVGPAVITSTSIDFQAGNTGTTKNIGTKPYTSSLMFMYAKGNEAFDPMNVTYISNPSIAPGDTDTFVNPAVLTYTDFQPGTAYKFQIKDEATGAVCPTKIETTLSTNPSPKPPVQTNPNQNNLGTNTNTTNTNQTTTTTNSTPETYNPTLLKNPLKSSYDTIPKIITAVIKDIMIPIAIPLLVIAFIWSGFLFVSARGNAEKIKKAKEAFGWTLAGAAIILACFVIAEAVQNTIQEVRGTNTSMIIEDDSNSNHV